jgi:DNA ligase-associated metallophosphoesterase
VKAVEGALKAEDAVSDHVITIAGTAVVADQAGALYWSEENLLAVADLHFEKGSSFARRGMLLPPYDTAATLARLALLIVRYAPRRVVALGDNFHDGEGASRLADSDRDGIIALQRSRDWIWIKGNHDPEPAEGIGGQFAATLTIGALTFRHEPNSKPAAGEIAGHLHPVALVSHRGRAVRRRCFACDGNRAVMPAFGAYAGGLNILHEAFSGLFERRAFTAHMLGDSRLYAFPAKQCLAD